MPNTANTIFPNNNSVVWQNQVVTGGQFGTGSSITDSRGSTISLAANNSANETVTIGAIRTTFAF